MHDFALEKKVDSSVLHVELHHRHFPRSYIRKLTEETDVASV